MTAKLESELNDIFHVTQVTRGTFLESLVAADVVRVEPGSASQVHRHNQAETVLYILDGSGIVQVGERKHHVSAGERVLVGKGVYHGVRTLQEPLRFLSVQSPPILDKARGTLDLEPLTG